MHVVVILNKTRLKTVVDVQSMNNAEPTFHSMIQ